MRLQAATADDQARVGAALGALGLPGAALAPALPFFRVAGVQRHAHLLEAGEAVSWAGVVLEGVLREYYVLDDGTERTRAFTLPGELFGSASDALQGRPSRVFCRAEVASRVATIEWARLSELARRSLDWERLTAAAIRSLYLKKSQREYELLALDAEGRYRALLETQPGLEKIVSQALIASYLGMTPVHLSRLRRRLRAAR